MPQRWKEKWNLVLLLTLHVVNSLVWCVALPIWQGTDEAAHFGLAQYIAETGRLPGRTERYLSDEIVASNELSDASRLPWNPTQRQTFVHGTEGLREDEIAILDPSLRVSFQRQAGNQVMLVPPLYGAVGALFYRMAYHRDIIERAFAIRFCSIALSTVALTFVYLLARELWPRQKRLWTTLSLLVAFQPQFTYSAAGGTSDVLATLWFTVLTYQNVRALRRRMSYSLAVWMGIALGLGLLTKPHLFLAGPALAVLFAYLWWTGRASRRKIVFCAIIVAGMGLALWSPWAIRSYDLNGNPFYDKLWSSGWVTVDGPQYDYPLVQYLWDYAISLGEGLFASYWGIFGYLDTPVAPVYYRVLQILTLLSASGLGWYLYRMRRACRSTKERAILLLLFVLALTPIFYFVYFDYTMWREMGIGWPLMGRHFAGPLAAQMLLWMWGLLMWIPERAHPAMHGIARAGIITLNYVCLFGYILPRYYL